MPRIMSTNEPCVNPRHKPNAGARRENLRKSEGASGW